MNPILAVLLGSAFKGEALGWTTVVANVLIVTAIMLALRPPPRVPEVARPPTFSYAFAHVGSG